MTEAAKYESEARLALADAESTHHHFHLMIHQTPTSQMVLTDQLPRFASFGIRISCCRGSPSGTHPPRRRRERTMTTVVGVVCFLAGFLLGRLWERDAL